MYNAMVIEHDGHEGIFTNHDSNVHNNDNDVEGDDEDNNGIKMRNNDDANCSEIPEGGSLEDRLDTSHKIYSVYAQDVLRQWGQYKKKIYHL